MRSLLFVCLYLLCSACAQRPQGVQEELLCTVLEDYLLRQVPFLPLPEETLGSIAGRKLLIYETTTYELFPDLALEAYFSYLDDSLEPIDQPEHFFTLNPTSCSTTFKWEWLAKEDLPYYRKQAPADVLLAREADGLLVLSPPAIDERAAQASVLVLFYCGRLCSSVVMLNLSKQGFTWKISSQQQISLS